MILLAFLFPLAVYLFVLGAINRRRHPLMVSGPWDFVGLLFAASGFLLFGGPGALSVLNDRWRDSLVFGQTPASPEDMDRLWQWWLFLMIAYFAAIVIGAGVLLWRSRNQTAIYNIDAAMLQTALGRVFERLGLRPSRSGNTFYFLPPNTALDDEHPAKPPAEQGIQAVPNEPVPSLRMPMSSTPLASASSVMLEVDVFQPMSHATLSWNPIHTALRADIEHELERELGETPAPQHLLGGILTVLGCFLFLSMFVIGFVVLIYRLLYRI